MAPSTLKEKHWGVVAEYANPKDLYKACEKVRDAGFKRWDAYTPFPVHGLDAAMGMKPSRLPWVVLALGALGLIAGFYMQVWMNSVSYPLVISGKDYLVWQAFIPVTFEITILFSAIGAVFGMIAINKLPMLFHPLFRVRRFQRVTDDRFFIAIESTDPKFDLQGTQDFLKEIGATYVEPVE